MGVPLLKLLLLAWPPAIPHASVAVQALSLAQPESAPGVTRIKSGRLNKEGLTVGSRFQEAPPNCVLFCKGAPAPAQVTGLEVSGPSALTYMGTLKPLIRETS